MNCLLLDHVLNIVDVAIAIEAALGCNSHALLSDRDAIAVELLYALAVVEYTGVFLEIEHMRVVAVLAHNFKALKIPALLLTPPKVGLSFLLHFLRRFRLAALGRGRLVLLENRGLGHLPGKLR